MDFWAFLCGIFSVCSVLLLWMCQDCWKSACSLIIELSVCTGLPLATFWPVFSLLHMSLWALLLKNGFSASAVIGWFPACPINRWFSTLSGFLAP
jgi:hypothetical protein